MNVPFGKTEIGTCSLCGGKVCVHTNWCCVIPDTPQCAQCGAVEDSNGPIIPMRKTITVTVR